MARPPTEPEPTPDEEKNGWTAEKLRAYLKECEAAAHNRIFPDRPALVVRGQKKFNPKKW